MEKKIWKVLEKIDDPELGVSLAGLGLVYEVKIVKKKVKIKMSLTSMGCPLFDVIEAEIKEKVGKINGVSKVEVELVWDPPWHQGMMNEDVKAELGVE
jgi:metal-sulfur cluster biosynthetic enzyme